MLQLLSIILASLAILVVMFYALFNQYRAIQHQEKRLKQHQKTALKHENNAKQLMLIAKKLDQQLREKKMYINADLSIQDLAAEIGTNRTYLSLSINTFYHQNFCTYINQYRFQELTDTIHSNHDYSHKELALRCGFGSVETMKRTVKHLTGLSLREWKDYLIKKDKPDPDDE